MEKLLSCGSSHQTLPESFVLPPEIRPTPMDAAAAASLSLPVIDLRGGTLGGDGHAEVVKQIISAGKDFGFFQVVNHGVPEEVISDMVDACEGFFRLPPEDKAPYYSEDPGKENRLFSGTIYNKNSKEISYWRDCLKLACYPVEDVMRFWPEKPTNFREVLARFIVAARGVAMKLLAVICEGLGLEDGYFEGDLSGGRVLINVNHYPPCPDPSLTLGLPPHCDRNLITLLLQGAVSGLQVLHDGKWIDVDPIPNAFVVNFGHQLEIVSNGLLKSVEHRAVTNSAAPRTSIATFVMPAMDCVIAPAKTLVGDDNPPLYRSFAFKDFLSFYVAAAADRGSVLEAFKAAT